MSGDHVEPKDVLKGRAILCMLKTNIHDHKVYRIRLDELRALVEAFGLEVVSEIIQTSFRPFAKYCVGKGKAKEIRSLAEKHDVQLVVFYNLINSSQKLNLIRETGCDVLDRYELTLEIFDQMASDNLSKLQIEAAKLDKLSPFYKLAANIHFVHDRPFFHSSGEYAFRGQLREITRRRASINKQIADLMIEKRRQIEGRRRLGYPSICIAGYYNAGKTSLFNALTGDNKPVSERPFTTLTSKYQKRFIDYETTVLFIDTIGFVLDLDHRLIKSFQINFEDIRSADLVILLFEITDPPMTLTMKLAEGISLLGDIGVPTEKILLVFNKVDKAPEAAETISQDLNLERYGMPWVSVSAKERINLDDLLKLIARRLRELKEKPAETPEEKAANEPG